MSHQNTPNVRKYVATTPVRKFVSGPAGRPGFVIFDDSEEDQLLIIDSGRADGSGARFEVIRGPFED